MVVEGLHYSKVSVQADTAQMEGRHLGEGGWEEDCQSVDVGSGAGGGAAPYRGGVHINRVVDVAD